MSRSFKIAQIITVLVIAAIAAVVFFNSRTPEVAEVPATVDVPAAAPSIAPQADATPAPQTPLDAESTVDENPEADDESDETPQTSADCISPNNASNHPLVMAEMKRLAPILPVGEDFEVFRGANRSVVRSMAVQGDSAAMYILAKMHMLASRGLPDERAYREILDFDQPRQLRRSAQRTRPSDEQRDFEKAEARKWFYQAALHGRLFAILELSFMDQQNGETLVTKGWITQEAFDELDPETRDDASIPSVYVAMADLLIPELSTGIGGALRDDQINIESLEPYAIQAADEFLADMSAVGQSLPVIPASTGPDWETFKERMCQPDAQQFPQ